MTTNRRIGSRQGESAKSITVSNLLISFSLSVALVASAVVFAQPVAPLVRQPEKDASAPKRRTFGVHTVAPVAKPRSESAAFAMPDVRQALKTMGRAFPKKRVPVVNVESFGAKGDGRTDDTEAIRAALASLRDGGTLEFSAKKVYVKTDVLTLDHANVTIWGNGATLYSITDDLDFEQKGHVNLAISMQADHTVVFGLQLSTNLRDRPEGHPHANGIWMGGSSQSAIGNRIEYAGIFVRSATDFVVAGNVVYRSTTDGIHVTDPSEDGWVVGNVVRETGDDSIAVVSYGLGAPSAGKIRILDNDVADQYWGRGISVVGGFDILIRGNSIARTPFAAGLLVHSETGYRTSNVRHVVLHGNHLRDIENHLPGYNPTGRSQRTGHAAIDIYGQGDQRVDDVLVEDNDVEGAGNDAIWIRGNSCGVVLRGNRLVNILGRNVRNDVDLTRSCHGADSSVKGDAGQPR